MVEMFRYFAGIATEIKGTTVPWSNDTLCYTTREPLGVVGAIIPWNAPLFFLTAAKLGPSLAAGNTASSSRRAAPLAVLRCLEIMQDYFPPGVANYISGYGNRRRGNSCRNTRMFAIVFVLRLAPTSAR